MNKHAAQEALETLEAERLVETVKLRNDLIKAARDLLPIATAEAAPGKACPHCKRAASIGHPGLLRLISRLAMRDVSLDRSRK